MSLSRPQKILEIAGHFTLYWKAAAKDDGHVKCVLNRPKGYRSGSGSKLIYFTPKSYFIKTDMTAFFICNLKRYTGGKK